MPENITNYDIDLNRVHANLANQDWDADSPYESGGAAHSLHHSIADALTKKIWRSVNHNTDARVERNGSWANLNFIITGGRGSGKSTFLRYLTHSLINGIPQGGSADGEYVRPPVIRKLFFCDPTAMSSNEDFLVSIVGALYDMVINAASCAGKGGVYRITGGEHEAGSLGYHTHEFHLGTPSPTCKEMIEEMAKGIKLLKAEESANSGLDPLSQLKHGFINSNRALELKSRFDQIVNQIAHEYHIDAFLIAIDDADIDSRENRRIMETIRKYLTHPRLIILFTCDMLLANETVREKHFAQFDTRYHNSDTPHQEHRWRIVDRMTAQYIKKIFPLSNLIELSSMMEVIQTSKQTYHVIFHEKNGNPVRVNLWDILNSVFSKTLAREQKDVQILVSAFLHLPLRSILTTLRCWDDWDFCRFLTKDEPAGLQVPDSGAGVKGVDVDALSELVARSLRVANVNELLSWGYTIEDLESASSYRLSKGLLRHSVLNDDLSNGYRLATFAIQYTYQESALMLASKMSVALRNLGDVFSCILFGAFTVHGFKYYQRLYPERTSGAGKEGILQDYRRYLFTSDNNDAMRWARKISIVYACYQMSHEGAEANLHPSRGVFLLTKDEDINVLNMTLNGLYRKFTRKDDYDSFLTYLLLRIMLGCISNTRNACYLSLYNLLGFVMACYKHAEAGVENEGQGADSPLATFIRSVIVDDVPNNSAPTWIQDFNAYHTGVSLSLDPRSESGIEGYVGRFVGEVEKWKETADSEFEKPKAPEVGAVAHAIHSTLYSLCANIASRRNIGNDTGTEDVELRAYNLHDIFEIGAEHWKTAAHRDSSVKDTCGIRGKIGRFVIMKKLAGILHVLTEQLDESAHALMKINEHRQMLVNFTEVEEKYRTRVSHCMSRIRSYFPNLLENKYDSPVEASPLLKNMMLSRSACMGINHMLDSIKWEYDGISDYVKSLELDKEDSYSLDKVYNLTIRRSMRQIDKEKARFRREICHDLRVNIDYSCESSKESLSQAFEYVQQVWSGVEKDLSLLTDIKGEVLDLDNLVAFAGNLISAYNTQIAPMKELERSIENAQETYSILTVSSVMKTLLVSLDYPEEGIGATGEALAQSIDTFALKYQKLQKDVNVYLHKAAKLIAGSVDKQREQLDNYLKFMGTPRVTRGEKKMSVAEWNVRRNFVLGCMAESDEKLRQVRKILLNRDSERGFSPMHRNFIMRYGLSSCFDALSRVLTNIREKGYVSPN